MLADPTLALVESLLQKPIPNNLATLLIVTKVRLIDLGAEMPASLVEGDEAQLKDWLRLSIETILERQTVSKKFHKELNELLQII